MSKPILYTFGGSVWAAVPALAILELDYPADAIQEKVVNLVEGANFDPVFVKINPNATLPTLVADGKAYTSTKDVVKFLVENASSHAQSKPSEIVDIVHADNVDPNFAMLAARNDEELEAKGNDLPGLFVRQRQAALEKVAPTAPSELASFYQGKLESNGVVTAIYNGVAPGDAKAGFFGASQAHWDSLRTFILTILPNHLPASGFINGSKPGEDDFHVGAWLARIVAVVGGSSDINGVNALEKELNAPVPEKVRSYWAAWLARSSWQQTYKDGLH